MLWVLMQALHGHSCIQQCVFSHQLVLGQNVRRTNVLAGTQVFEFDGLHSTNRAHAWSVADRLVTVDTLG